jgi:hypothetical protein
MLELQVASFLGNLPPAIRFKDADNLSTFHVYKYTSKVPSSTARRSDDFSLALLATHGFGFPLPAWPRRDAYRRRQPGRFSRRHADRRLDPANSRAVSQFEKAALIAKLKAARERKKLETG